MQIIHANNYCIWSECLHQFISCFYLCCALNAFLFDECMFAFLLLSYCKVLLDAIFKGAIETKVLF